MALYKMELYKILRRPIVWVSGFAALVLLAFYLFSLPDGCHSMVEGQDPPLFGYEAVRQDREITAEYEGILTDETLRRIVETHGFPSKVMRGYAGGIIGLN